MTQPANFLTLLFVGFSIFLTSLIIPAAGYAGAPTLAIYDGFDVVTEHQLGDHLFVIIDDADPLTTYTAKLVDEMGFVVASQMLTTDDSGWVDPTLLWHRSGVEGCTPGASPNPLEYRFTHFSEAEALGGRAFALELRDSADQIVVSNTVPLVVDTAPRYYFSTPDGCLIDQYVSGDMLWVTGIHLDTEPSADPNGNPSESHSLWLLNDQSPWQLGTLLEDIRKPYQDTGQELIFSDDTPMETQPVLNFRAAFPCIYGTVQPAFSDPGPLPNPPEYNPNTLLDPIPEVPVPGPGTAGQGSCPPCEAP